MQPEVLIDDNKYLLDTVISLRADLLTLCDSSEEKEKANDSLRRVAISLKKKLECANASIHKLVSEHAASKVKEHEDGLSDGLQSQNGQLPTHVSDQASSKENEEIIGLKSQIVNLHSLLEESLKTIERIERNLCEKQRQYDTLQSAHGHAVEAINSAYLVKARAKCDTETEMFAPPPGAAGGGVPLSGSNPGQHEHQLNHTVEKKITRGKGRTKKTRDKWKGIAIHILQQRFSPLQLRMTVASVHADLFPGYTGLKEQIEHIHLADPASLLAMLPQGIFDKQIKLGMQRFSNSMQDHWSVNACMGLKYRSVLSREKYCRMRVDLSSTFDNGSYTRQSFNGILFPQLQTRYQIDKRVKEIQVATGMTSFDGGLGVMIELRELMRLNILEYLDKGLFVFDPVTARVMQQIGAELFNPDLMNLLDSARHHKGMKVTSAGCVFPHGTEHPMAPSNTHEYGHIEGGDGNADMAGAGAPILQGKRSFILLALANNDVFIFSCIAGINEVISNPMFKLGRLAPDGREVHNKCTQTRAHT